MEAYHYWTILGLILIGFELLNPKTILLVLGGACLFAAVFAFKLPDNFLFQALAFVISGAILLIVSKQYLKKGLKK